jgi:hypothetical protein
MASSLVILLGNTLRVKTFSGTNLVVPMSEVSAFHGSDYNIVIDNNNGSGALYGKHRRLIVAPYSRHVFSRQSLTRFRM